MPSIIIKHDWMSGEWRTTRKIRGYFIEDYERWKKKRLLRLLRYYILLESEDG